MRGYVILGAILALAVAVPLGWKWQLGVGRVALVVLADSMLVAILLTVLDPLLHFTVLSGTLAMFAATVAAALAVLLTAFFRDPDRLVPNRSDVVVSPADGHIVYLHSVEPGRVPTADKRGHKHGLRELAETGLTEGGAVAVGISMNLADVHVNRAPIAGRIRLLERVPGTFGSLRKPEMLLSNERVTTLFDGGDLQIAQVQIASRLVRGIVTFVSKDDVVELGQRVGAIRFGSQVDLIIPARNDISLTVQVGDRVVAGRTIIATITDRPHVAARVPVGDVIGAGGAIGGA